MAQKSQGSELKIRGKLSFPNMEGMAEWVMHMTAIVRLKEVRVPSRARKKRNFPRGTFPRFWGNFPPKSSPTSTQGSHSDSHPRGSFRLEIRGETPYFFFLTKIGGRFPGEDSLGNLLPLIFFYGSSGIHFYTFKAFCGLFILCVKIIKN